MIKAVIFDFGQTLVDSSDGFRAAEKEMQTRIFSDLRVSSRDEFLSHYRIIRKEFHGRSEFSRKTIAEAVYGHFGEKPPTERLEQWERDYWERVMAETTIFPEAQHVLKSLSADYRLALITNTQGQKTTGNHRISRFPELTKYFEFVIVAGDSGIPEKPDPKPFHLCLKRLGLTPPDAVYVGDDWRIDVCGAGDVGMQPIWLQHHSVHRNWPKAETSAPIITDLTRLLDLPRLLS